MSIQTPKIGTYKHYKGKTYKVLGVAKHSETLEDLVVYQKLYDDHGLWVRPLSMFMEEVEVDGEVMPRFEYMGTSIDSVQTLESFGKEVWQQLGGADLYIKQERVSWDKNSID